MAKGTFQREVKEFKCPFENGEIVDCIMLESTYIPAYLKECEEMRKKPSFKEGGIQWKFAVLRRNADTEEPTPVWQWDETEFLAPDYKAVYNIDWEPPARQRIRKTKNGEYFTSDFVAKCGLDSKNKTTGLPNIFAWFPTAYAITKDEYAEKKRKNEWNQIIDEYEENDEKGAIEWINDKIARRYLICRISEENPDKYEYLDLTPGIIFRAKIRIKEYVYFDSFGFVEKKLQIYATCKSLEATNKRIADAEGILKAHKKAVEKFNENKEKTKEFEGKQKEEEEDDVPW